MATLDTFPAADYIINAARTEAEDKVWRNELIQETLRTVRGAAEPEDQTIATGAIEPDGGGWIILARGGALDADLETITGTHYREGSIIVITADDDAHTITFKHGADNINTLDGEDVLLNENYAFAIELSFDGTDWTVVRAFYTPDVRPHGYELFTAGGTFTVPAGVTEVLLTGVGGGGGGGGGAVAAADGTNGTAAADANRSRFIAVATTVFSGGGFGYGGFKEGGGGRGGGNGGLHGGTTDGTNIAYGGNSSYTQLGVYGRGGAGGSGEAGVGGGGGGGDAGDLEVVSVAVVPGSSYTVEIGVGCAGGAAGGAAASAGATGEDGAILVQW